nr:flocculation protein FLO11-like [Oncorhynchus nerka]
MATSTQDPSSSLTSHVSGTTARPQEGDSTSNTTINTSSLPTTPAQSTLSQVDSVLQLKPSNTVDSSTTPKPSNTVDSNTTPKPSNTVDSSTTPKPSNTVDSNTTPKPSNTVDSNTTPKPSNTVDSNTTPKPSNTVDSNTTPKPSNTVDSTSSSTTPPSNTVDLNTSPSPSSTVDSSTTPSPEDGSTLEVTTSTPVELGSTWTLQATHTIPAVSNLVQTITSHSDDTTGNTTPPVTTTLIQNTVSKETTETDHKNIITSHKDTQTLIAHLRVSIVSAGDISKEEIIEALHHFAAQVQAFLQREYCNNCTLRIRNVRGI